MNPTVVAAAATATGKNLYANSDVIVCTTIGFDSKALKEVQLDGTHVRLYPELPEDALETEHAHALVIGRYAMESSSMIQTDFKIQTFAARLNHATRASTFIADVKDKFKRQLSDPANMLIVAYKTHLG